MSLKARFGFALAGVLLLTVALAAMAGVVMNRAVDASRKEDLRHDVERLVAFDLLMEIRAADQQARLLSGNGALQEAAAQSVQGDVSRFQELVVRLRRELQLGLLEIIAPDGVVLASSLPGRAKSRVDLGPSRVVLTRGEVYADLTVERGLAAFVVHADAPVKVGQKIVAVLRVGKVLDAEALRLWLPNTDVTLYSGDGTVELSTAEPAPRETPLASFSEWEGLCAQSVESPECLELELPTWSYDEAGIQHLAVSGALRSLSQRPMGVVVAARNLDANDPRFAHFAGSLSDLRSFTIALAAVLGGVALLLGLMLARTVLRRIAQVRDFTRSLSEGNLTDRLPVSTSDELGRMAESLNAVAAQLQSMIAAVADVTTRISTASVELSATARENTVGADRQSESTEKVSSAMSEMAVSAAQVAATSADASSLALKGLEVAAEGERVVAEAIDATQKVQQSMGDWARMVAALGEKSVAVGEITGLIDEIATQTNMLALNARIEAARSGEQGQGFAVVASEVKALAERTAAATRDIDARIKAMQSDVRGVVTSIEGGAQTVVSSGGYIRQAGTTIDDLVKTVKNVRERVAQIAEAAKEQSTAAEEISRNSAVVLDTSREFSQAAQQTFEAAADLQKLSEQLTGSVSRFRV